MDRPGYPGPAGQCGATLACVGGRPGRWRRYLAIAVLAVAAGAVLYKGWGSAHLREYEGFAAGVVARGGGWAVWVWRAGQHRPGARVGADELGHRADVLAVAIHAQWAKAAGERGLLGPEPLPVRWVPSGLPLAGPAAAAVAARRFDPLPGLPAVQDVAAGTGQISGLHALYGGLGSGRLVIAGPPGAGKSGAAVLLILAALQYREQSISETDRHSIPVPVLLTASDWKEPVADWLAAQLVRTYPMFTGPGGQADAAALAASGKVALLLDGLDEMAEEQRPAAIAELNQAPFRVVVLSRTAEMAAAAARAGILDGAAAIELCPIDPDTAAGYLARAQLHPPPPAWQELLDRIRQPHTALAQALDNPLTLTLVKDTYRTGDSARDLLSYCDHPPGGRTVTDITGHLLDQFIRITYTPQPGKPPPRYDLPTAHRTLTRIAAAMNDHNTRDLQWWRLPQWAPRGPRVITTTLVGGLVLGLVGGLVDWLSGGLVLGLGLVAGLVAGLAVGFVAGRSGEDPARTPRQLRVPALHQALTRGMVTGMLRGLVAGLVLGFVLGLLLGLAGGLEGGLEVGLAGGIVVGLAGGIGGGIAGGLKDRADTSVLDPVSSRRADRHYALVVALVVGLAVWFVIGLVGGLVGGLVAGIAFGLVVGLVVGLLGGFVLGESRGWPASLAAMQLAIRWHTPLRLMRFLDDARERNVLRTVGPVYQFRHAQLQDRLSHAASADDSS
jgi:hypothetical protein